MPTLCAIERGSRCDWDRWTRAYHAEHLGALVGVKLTVLGCDRNQTVPDELLIEQLRALDQRIDPVPRRVQTDARVVFSDARGFAPAPPSDLDESDHNR